MHLCGEDSSRKHCICDSSSLILLYIHVLCIGNNVLNIHKWLGFYKMEYPELQAYEENCPNSVTHCSGTTKRSHAKHAAKIDLSIGSTSIQGYSKKSYCTFNEKLPRIPMQPLP